jgi:hypothetical protein
LGFPHLGRTKRVSTKAKNIAGQFALFRAVFGFRSLANRISWLEARMTCHFLTKNGETVDLLCALDHDFEGWPQRIRVRDVNCGAETIILTNDLRPLVGLQGSEFASEREQFRALVYALPDCKEDV